VLAARHDQDMARHVFGARALVGPDDDGADDAAEEVAAGIDLAAARQGLTIRFAHTQLRIVNQEFGNSFSILNSRFLITLNRVDPHPDAPAVLWRLTRDRSTAHATIFPGERQTTLTWFFDGVMDRAENYDSEELALARSEEIRGRLLRDGWKAVG
jgi:hypothetical protein